MNICKGQFCVYSGNEYTKIFCENKFHSWIWVEKLTDFVFLFSSFLAGTENRRCTVYVISLYIHMCVYVCVYDSRSDPTAVQDTSGLTAQHNIKRDETILRRKCPLSEDRSSKRPSWGRRSKTQLHGMVWLSMYFLVASPSFPPGLLVLQWMFLSLFPDGSQVKRLWKGWPLVTVLSIHCLL